MSYKKTQKDILVNSGIKLIKLMKGRFTKGIEIIKNKKKNQTEILKLKNSILR